MSSPNYPALLNKDFEKVISRYTDQFDGAHGADDGPQAKDKTTSSRRQRDDGGRATKAAQVSDSYYEFATAAYETNWSTRFHYAPFSPADTLHSAQCFYEHRIALLMGLRPGMRVLDVGCGIGGPAREIARFTGCEVVGISINQTQIDRAIQLTAREGLMDKCTFVRGDFLNIPFRSDIFDAAFAIEATCHAPSLKTVYAEICRVLKPGGVCLVSEWVMTPRFDRSNARHVEMRTRIERGNGVVNLRTSVEAREAMVSSGFDLVHEEDFAGYYDYLKRRADTRRAEDAEARVEESTESVGCESDSDQDQDHGKGDGKRTGRERARGQARTTTPATSVPAPPPPSPRHREWWWMLEGRTAPSTTWTDWWTAWKMSPFARRACYALVWSLEKLGYPRARGVCEAMDILALCVDSVAEAGKEGIFSPSWWFMGRKPSAEHS
ncbi:hypothetical protein PV08_06266 [Exophiala spinifera]|uniref:Sterol 24-C-methyltransferase n=1 Tax=Exophiala spinifera TaxID=91928 RepID=A0A0D2BC63_9EURO|nr:uncharacterized protein PV08_06266 [Exophiala spinifera]KIW16215.1 hypothetical protein PV08_06266 [Exophiala spinifera]